MTIYEVREGQEPSYLFDTKAEAIKEARGKGDVVVRRWKPNNKAETICMVSAIANGTGWTGCPYETILEHEV